MRNMTLKQHTEEAQMKLEASKSFVTTASIRCYVCGIVINGSCFFLFFSVSWIPNGERLRKVNEKRDYLLHA